MSGGKLYFNLRISRYLATHNTKLPNKMRGGLGAVLGLFALEQFFGKEPGIKMSTYVNKYGVNSGPFTRVKVLNVKCSQKILYRPQFILARIGPTWYRINIWANQLIPILKVRIININRYHSYKSNMNYQKCITCLKCLSSKICLIT